METTLELPDEYFQRHQEGINQGSVRAAGHRRQRGSVTAFFPPAAGIAVGEGKGQDWFSGRQHSVA